MVRTSVFQTLAGFLMTFNVAAFSSNASFAQSGGKSSGIANVLSSTIGKKSVEQSIQFVRLSDGATLFQKNAMLPVSPASVTKLVTSAAVLAKFGPSKKFMTRFYHSGTRQGETINGDLIIVGDGDPFIVSEKLWEMAADLSHLGIKRITGNIIIDNSLFDAESRDQPRLFGEKSSVNAYDAPVSAFGVNFNTVAIALAPSFQAGSDAFAGLDPLPLNGFRLDNRVKTLSSLKNSSIQAERVSNGELDTVLTLTGQMSLDSSIKKVYRSVGDHVRTAGESVRAFLQRMNITVNGLTREGFLPPGAKLLYELESYDLAKIVSGLNKFSNNYIADVLLKRMGAAFPISAPPESKGSGTYSNGLNVLRSFLKEDVKVKPTFVLENGSGLNTENRLSAEQMTMLLAYMARHLQYFPEFLASLPASGWDGTLRDRFGGTKSTAMQGEVRAKTGTLSAPITVVSLAGYIRHPKHGFVAFALLENGTPGKPQPSIADLRDRQDRALDYFMHKF